MAQKNDWALIHNIVLPSTERAPQTPDDTKAVPLELWVKGHLTHDAQVGQNATVVTRTGRQVTGTLIEVNPSYTHGFGKFVPELLQIGDSLRAMLFGGESA